MFGKSKNVSVVLKRVKKNEKKKSFTQNQFSNKISIVMKCNSKNKKNNRTVDKLIL